MAETEIVPERVPGGPARKPLIPPQQRLTGKQRAFVDSYMGAGRFSATQAAAVAFGVSGHVAAARGRDYVQKAAVQHEIGRRFALHGMASVEVIARLAGIARADFCDVAECKDAFGHLDWAKVSERGLGHMIRSVKRTRHGDVVTLEPRLQALELIARHLGMLHDKLDVQHTDFTQLSSEQLEAIARGVTSR